MMGVRVAFGTEGLDLRGLLQDDTIIYNRFVRTLYQSLEVFVTCQSQTQVGHSPSISFSL